MTASVARQAASGVAWNMGTGVAVRAIGLAGTLVLTRFIAPGEYGEVSAALICVLTATRLFTFGLGPYVIAYRASPGETYQALVCHVTAIAVACTGVVLLREPLSAALGSPGMARFIPGLALASLITQASHIPSATLVRSMSFRIVALSRAAGDVTFTAIALVLAPVWGPVAIVVGNLCRAVLTSLLLIARSDKAEWLRPTALRWRTARRAFAFGFPLTAASLAETLATSGDNLLMSRLFGPKVMGQYNLAYNLASTPTGQVAEHIGDVLLPSFAKMTVEQRHRALPRAAGLMSLLLFPLSAGLSAVSATLVPALLDPRWAGLAPMLEILCALALPYPVIWLVGAFLAAEGRTTPLMSMSFLKAAMVVGLILTMGRLGPMWACVGVAVAFALHGVAYLIVGWRLAGIPPRPLLVATVRPLAASAAMFVAVVGVRGIAMGAGLEPGIVLLALEVTVGALAYAGAAFALARPAVLELSDLAVGVLKGRKG